MITIEKVCKSSDDFFASLDPDEKFDLVFIDGDHRYNAVANDYNNAVKHIKAKLSVAKSILVLIIRIQI